MRTTLLAVAAAFLLPVAAVAEQAPQQDHHAQLVQKVQEVLNARGFDAGPLNGLNMGKTQAAVGQFQRSVDLPVSGMLDARTLLELGVEFDRTASAGSSAMPENSAATVAPEK